MEAAPPSARRSRAAPASVAHSHACARTYSKPSIRSRRIPPVSSRAGGWGDMRLTASADTPNVAASTTSASPTPSTAIRKPPSAGPAKRSPTGSISSFTAFACRSWSRGTTSGTTAENAGWKSACPTPVDHHQRDHLLELGRLRQGQGRDRRDGDEAHQVGGDHQPPALEAVAQHPRDQQRGDHRKRPGEAQQAERRRLVRDVEDEPRDRDQIDAVADQRNGLAEPEQPEVAVAK